MPLFRKDFSVFRPKERTIQVPPVAGTPSPSIAEPPPSPRPFKRAVVTYHSTLLLLDKCNLPQEPKSYWSGEVVEETPSSRNERGRTVFDPESKARIAHGRLAREARRRT